MWKALDRLSIVAVLVAAGVVIWFQLNGGSVAPAQPRSDISAPREPVSLSTAPRIGSQTAPVGMIVFSDFECPFCAKFAVESWPELKREFVDTGRLAVFFWQFPIPELHAMATDAAHASECAARQGQFWAFHDQLFRVSAKPGSVKLSRGVFQQVAADLKLDLAKFERCTSGEAEAKVRADVDAAKKFGIHSTPLFFLGRQLADGTLQAGQIIKGARPINEFKQAITTMQEMIEQK